MKKIEAFEQAIANKVKDLRAEGINPTLSWAYRDAFGNTKSRTLQTVSRKTGLLNLQFQAPSQSLLKPLQSYRSMVLKGQDLQR